MLGYKITDNFDDETRDIGYRQWFARATVFDETGERYHLEVYVLHELNVPGEGYQVDFAGRDRGGRCDEVWRAIGEHSDPSLYFDTLEEAMAAVDRIVGGAAKVLPGWWRRPIRRTGSTWAQSDDALRADAERHAMLPDELEVA